MDIGKQFSHATVALGLLPGQFELSTKLRSIVSAVADQCQAIEDALWELYSMRWRWIAEGAQLDGLGDIVGEPRTTDDDDIYRGLIEVKILTNTSVCEPERIIRCVNIGMDSSECHIIEKDYATIVIYAHLLTRNGPIAARMSDIAAGGVKVAVTGSEEDPFVFGLDRDTSGTGYGTELDYGDGWGETGAGNESIGGDFTELYHEH